MPPAPSELADPARRPAALARLAARHGAADLLVLAPDPDTGRPRPVLGLRQTLPGTPRWRALLKLCRAPGERDVVVDALVEGGPDVGLRVWTGPDGDTLAFVAPTPSCRPADVARGLGLAFALFRSELAADVAAARARVAQDAADQGSALLESLEAVRVQLGRKAEALTRTLAVAENTNAALQVANASLDAERRAAERAADTDALTGLASRSAFERRLALAVAATAAGGEPLSLALIDLDGFKEINDTRGHAAGDAALVAVGARLRAACGAQLAARLGGDEFALVLEGASPEAAMARARGVQQLIRTPLRFGGEDLPLRCTVGIAALPGDAASAADLLRKADLGLYDAKRNNKGALSRYRPGMEALFDERRRAAGLLRGALDDGRVAVHYQPKVSLVDGALVGYEALARLHGEGGALLGPDSFGTALSDQESARLLGSRMLDLVLHDLAACRAAGLPQRPVAVNVSGPEISSPGFARAFLARVGRARVGTRLIEVEITETALLGDRPAEVKASLGLLRAAGVSVSLDDFGTGYSSLSYLLDWDVDCIKIDRSFVGDMSGASRSTRIVRSIVDLARGLGLGVVAEGVETAAQAEHLKAIGCPLAQGYFFGRAAPPEATLLRGAGPARAGARLLAAS